MFAATISDLPDVFNNTSRVPVSGPKAEIKGSFNFISGGDDRIRMTFMRRSGLVDYPNINEHIPDKEYLKSGYAGRVLLPYVDSESGSVFQVLIMPHDSLRIASMDIQLSHPNVLKFHHKMIKASDDVWIRVRLYQPFDELKEFKYSVNWESPGITEKVAFDLAAELVDTTAYLHSQGIAGISNNFYIAKKAGEFTAMYIIDHTTAYASGAMIVDVERTQYSRYNDISDLSQQIRKMSDAHPQSQRLKELAAELASTERNVELLTDDMDQYKDVHDWKKEFTLPDIDPKLVPKSDIKFVTDALGDFSRSIKGWEDAFFDMLYVLMSLDLHHGLLAKIRGYVGEYPDTLIYNWITQEYIKYLPLTQYVRMPWTVISFDNPIGEVDPYTYHSERRRLIERFDTEFGPHETYGYNMMGYDSIVLRETGFRPIGRETKVDVKRIEDVASSAVSSVVLPMPAYEYVVVNGVEFKSRDILAVFFDTPLATVAETVESYVFSDMTEGDIKLVRDVLCGRVMFLTFFKGLSSSAFTRLGGANTLLGMYEVPKLRKTIDFAFVLGMSFVDQIRGRILDVWDEPEYEYFMQRLDVM